MRIFSLISLVPVLVPALALASQWSTPVYSCTFANAANARTFQEQTGVSINSITVQISIALRQAQVEISKKGGNRLVFGDSCFATSVEGTDVYFLQSKASFPCGHMEDAEPVYTMSLTLLRANETGEREAQLVLGGGHIASGLVCKPAQ